MLKHYVITFLVLNVYIYLVFEILRIDVVNGSFDFLVLQIVLKALKVVFGILGDCADGKILGNFSYYSLPK